MFVLLDERADRRRGIFRDDPHRDSFLLKVNSARRNSGDFEQFIDDPHQLSHLTFDDAGGLLDDRILDAL